MARYGIKNAQLPGESFRWEGGPIGVLLFHGFTATTAEVRLLGEFLHREGYTVAGPLLPGHGTSIRGANRCRWTDWTVAAEEAYRRLAADCDPVVVGGESMGGLLALYLASEHPEIAAVLAYAPALRVRSPLRSLLVLAPLLARVIPAVSLPPGPPSVVDERWKGYEAYPIAAAVQFLRLQREVAERLSRVDQPLLTIQGRLDRLVDPEVPARLQQAVSSRKKEMHWLAQSEHCLLLDREWEQAAEWTADFLRRVLARQEVHA
jgi:carboxylesterase